MFRKLFDHPTERQNQKPLKNNTDTYLSAEQRCAKIERDQASIARSNDAALAAAMQASLIELDTVAEKKQAQAHAYFNESNRANSTRTDQRPKPSKADFLSQEQIFAM